MSTDISRVYVFLSKLGDWKAQADLNGDGTVIKTEFKNFMLDSFEWEGENDSDKITLINNFWAEVDTDRSGSKIAGTKFKNKNALSDKEIKAMEKKFQMYEKLNDYISGLQAPSGVDASAWNKSVKESLANKLAAFIKTNPKATPDDVADFLQSVGPETVAMTTANETAEFYFNKTFINNFRQYGYDFKKDTTLSALIDNYVKNNIYEGEGDDKKAKDVSTIQAEIRALMDAYYASANPSSMSAAQKRLLPSANGEGGSLNYLQECIVKTEINKNLSTFKSGDEYKKHSAEFDKAIEDFINRKISEGTSFNALKSLGVNDFKNSQEYNNIKKTFAVDDLFTKTKTEPKTEITSSNYTNNDLYLALKNDLGEDFAKRFMLIVQADNIFTLKQEIMSQAKDKALNGDFDVNGSFNYKKICDWILEQCKLKIADFYPNGFADISIQQLGTLYDAMVKADINNTKKAALDYCNALIDKHYEPLANAVYQVFGEKYQDQIKNVLISSDIQTKMTSLKTLVGQIGEPIDEETMRNNFKTANPNYWDKLKNITVGQGSNKEVAKLDNFFKINDKVITSDKITFSATGNFIVDSKSGVVKINPNIPAGQYTGTIFVYVDGVQVANSGSINFDVSQIDTTEVISTVTDTTLKLNTRVDNWNQDAKFLELYNDNKNVILYGQMDNGGSSWGGRKDVIKKNLYNLGDDVIAILETAGLKKSILTTAKDNICKKYFDAGPVFYRNNKGDSRGYLIDHCNDYIKNEREKTKSRIVQTQDSDGSDSNVYMIRFSDFVDDIINEYKRLISE